MAQTKGRGWHGESMRHSMAAVLGHARRKLPIRQSGIKAGWSLLGLRSRSGKELWVHSDSGKISFGKPGMLVGAERLDEIAGEGVYVSEEAAEDAAADLRADDVPGENVYVSTTGDGFWEVISEMEND